MAYDWKTELPGVVSLHSEECPVRDGRECLCGPLGFRASIRDGETKLRTVSTSFDTPLEALTWQRDQATHREGPSAAAHRPEVGALIDDFLQSAEDGLAQDSRGMLYTPERLRALRGGLSYVDSELGRMAADDVRRHHVQGLIAQLRGAGVDETRVVAVADGLHELYSYAIRRDVVGFSPVVELGLPEPGTAPPRVNGQHPPVTSGEAPWASLPFHSPLAPPRHAAQAREESFGTPPPFSAPGYPSGGYPTPAPSSAPDYPSGGYPTPAPFSAPGYSSGGFPTPAPSSAPDYPSGGYPTPAPFSAPGYSSGGFPTPAPFSAPGYTSGGYAAFPAPPNGHQGSGPFSAAFGVPGNVPDANYDATMQERWLWWTVRIVVIVFVLISLVLVAESV